ncbi:hypothetical protein M0R45_009005 [Rubus argutus]|uniref:Uncharacterized protein n=1 Tax=Rubus argutus TaxID=59490 RepID=A0AAW1Y5P6_RUBAR
MADFSPLQPFHNHIHHSHNQNHTALTKSASPIPAMASPIHFPQHQSCPDLHQPNHHNPQIHKPHNLQFITTSFPCLYSLLQLPQQPAAIQTNYPNLQSTHFHGKTSPNLKFQPSSFTAKTADIKTRA